LRSEADLPPQNPAFTDYYQRFRQSVAKPQPAPEPEPISADPYVSELRRMREEEVRRNLLLGGSPEAMGKALSLGRELDVPPALVVDRLADAERGRDVARWGALQERYPAIGKWAVSNPPASVVARDDWDSLSLLGKAWRSVRETVGGLGGTLEAGAYQLGSLTEDALGAASDVADAVDPSEAVWGAFSDLMGTFTGYNPRIDEDIRARKQMSRAARAERVKRLDAAADAARPVSTSWVARELLAGVESVPMAAGALLTRDATKAGAVLGMLTGAGAYQDARAGGADIGTALAYGARQGTVEALTERIPASRLLGDIAAKSPFGKMLLGQLVTEIPGEQAATMLQDLDEFITLRPEATLADFIASRPEAMRQTLLGTLGAVGTTTGAVRTLQLASDGAANLAARTAEAQRARREGQAIAALGDAAEKSKLRSRDPDAYANLMRAMAEEQGVDDVYIDADAVREFLQSDEFDPDGPFAPYVDQAVEALAVGGDLVIPVEEALARFPGTPAWDKLRDHMRLSAAGMSKADADAFNDDVGTMAQQLDEEVAAFEERDREAMAGGEALRADVTAKLQNAGYMPDAARTMAEVVAARYETRAARQGAKVTGQEFAGVEVRQVLPEKLAQAMAAKAGEGRKNDGLDPVIDDMRRGVSAPGAGPSLLEFIAKRGGIEDVGGDIASMGGDRWHRDGSFRRKLIVPTVKGQAGMFGAGPRNNTPELVLQAAIEAGYFPELEGRVQDGYEDAVDTRTLLDAIGEELAGSARYAREVDSNRADAVAELEQLVANEGLDPRTATRKEIRDAVAAYSARQSGEGGRGFEQAGLVSKDVLAAWNGTQTRGAIDLGPLPQVLADYGIKADRLVFDRAKIAKVGRAHGDVGAATISQLSELIGDYWAIYPSNDSSTARTMVALRQRDAAGRPIVMAIGTRAGAAGPEAYVASVYGKDAEGPRSGDDRVKQAIAAAKRKGQKLLEGAAPPSYSEPISDMTAKRQGRSILSVKPKGKGRTFDQAVDAVKGVAARVRSAVMGDGAAFDQDARGRISFPGPDFDGTAVIELFESRNLSTFLHEFGHLTLEELRYDAERAGEGDPLRKDWEAVEAWFAASGHPIVGGVIPTEAHEIWARAFEGYLLEGKAPTAALRNVFETVRAWLINIYRSLRALNTPITPEIRGVMDRLLATDDDIALASKEQQLTPLLDGKGMTGPEFAAYQKLVGEARGEARRAMLDRTVRDVRAREGRRFRRQREALLEEVAEDVFTRPAFRAIDLMRRLPVDRQWIVENVGSSAAATFPGGVPPLLKDGGAHPDAIAEQAGFATGYDMVLALVALEEAHRAARQAGDKRGLRERVIHDEVDAMMRERYGEPLTDGGIEREAIAAVHNELQGEVIAAEARVLARQSGNSATPYAAARRWARTKVREGRVNQQVLPAALQRYAKAAKKAAGEAERAYLARDIDGAFRAKQQQMLNNALLSEAKEAAEEVETARRRLARWAAKRTMKAVDQDYLEQAHALMEAAEFKQRSQKDLRRQASWESWAAKREAEGYDIVVPKSFEASLAKQNWTRMPVEEFLGLDAAVRQIMHLGRMKKELRDGQEKREFEATVAEAVGAAAKLPQRPPSDLMEPGVMDAIKSKVAAVDAALLKMETVFDWLDSGDSGGIFNRIVFRPLADAQEAERLKFTAMLEQLNGALEKIPQKTVKSWSDKVSAPELLNRETGNPFVLTREQLVSMALNIGNQGNLDKLTGGYGWSEEGVRAVLNRTLTEAEWTYVQEVWDIINSLWPEIAAMERRINGIAPDKIEAIPVPTKFGVLNGGYFPVVYDPAKNYDSEANAAKSSNLFENIYTRATTPKGFTKERTEVERPVHLSLGIINRHVGEVVHDITHREAVMQADKFLSDAKVMKAVDDTLGPEIRRSFRPWLQRIANEWAYDRAAQQGIARFVQAARLNTTIVAMGYRVSTVMMQAAGYSNSIERVGAQWVVPRMKDIANPEAYRFVLENSKEVAGRMSSLDRDIRDQVRKAAGVVGSVSAVKQFAFHGVGYMDRVVVVPTWLGAYDKALASGKGHDDAVYEADKAVRQSQGAGGAKDLAAIQSGRGTFGEAAKLLTMFYSYMSAFYQRQRTFARDVRQAKLADAPGLLARAWWLFVVPPLLAEMLAGRVPGEDDDESWMEWASSAMLFQILGPIPIVRDFAPVAWARASDQPTFGYRFTPVAGAVESSVNVAGDVSNVIEGEDTKRATRNAIETVGYFTGLTTGQMATTAQFLVDVGYGEQDPEGFGEWWRGLTKGKVE
jgi:hypothetical protein